MGGVIVVRSLGSGEEREITPRLAQWGLLVRMSPDGRSFLVHGRDTRGQAGIFSVSAETGEPRLLVAHEPPGFVRCPVNARLAGAPPGSRQADLRPRPSVSRQ